MAQMMLGQLGVDPGGQQQLMQHFGGIMQALRQSSGACLSLWGQPAARGSWQAGSTQAASGIHCDSLQE
jgi:hypothetical protein